MNTNVSCLALAAVAVMATTTLDPAATAGGGKDREITTSTIVISGDEMSVGGAHTFEVKVTDGEVTVTIDGEELPASRFRAEGGELVILDEEGRELKSFGVLLGQDDDDFQMTWVGQEPWVDIDMVFPEGRPNVLVGIHMDEPDEALRYHLRLEEGQTTMLRGLYKGLPAHQAGLGRFDIIVAVDGQEPADPKSVMKALADKEPGDEITFTVIQKGRTKEYSVTLEAFDPKRMDPSALIGGGTARITIPELKFGQGLPGGEEWKLLIDPESRESFRKLEQFKLPEGFQKDLRKQLRESIPRDLDDRMEVLNDRLQEMQEMIDRLVEQARELAREADEG
ncbi:MAG: PDZ domain-containing protein [Planctomycetota bacterium]|jgi:hypothetical protein